MMLSIVLHLIMEKRAIAFLASLITVTSTDLIKLPVDLIVTPVKVRLKKFTY